ncbi:MAG: hypothetical protein FVQ80_13950 [Planctomycetes bacterium]|nr:hypothetical protein [Planctomycetota bacterium]
MAADVLNDSQISISEDRKREKIIHHKKNTTAIILAMAYGDFGDANDAVIFLKNRLYDDDEIYQIFQILLKKRDSIKKAPR